MDTDMRPHAVNLIPRPPEIITRRTFLQAPGLAFACCIRPLAAGFTALGDELAALLMRWWVFRPIPLLAAG